MSVEVSDKDKNKIKYNDILGLSMHHLANSMTKLCHGRKQDSAGWEGIPKTLYLKITYFFYGNYQTINHYVCKFGVNIN